MDLLSLILTAVCGTPSEAFLGRQPARAYSTFNLMPIRRTQTYMRLLISGLARLPVSEKHSVLPW